MRTATHNSRPVVVVGGGPAGMMAGLLFARAGNQVTVLEKHEDFLRDFRGDTVHPSTLELFHQLGWLEELLALPHSRIEEIGLRVAGREWKVASFRALKVAAPFIAMMPQWDLLDFIAEKAPTFPTFTLRMGSEAVNLTRDAGGRVDGVVLASGERLPSGLVIAADGRRSVLRQAAQMPLETLGAPMDIFWFRLAKGPEAPAATFGVLAAGRMLVLIDRRDYLQCAYLFLKGGAERLRARGIGVLREELRELVPELAPSIAALENWDQVKLLEVALGRLTRWHQPGLLAIGDAAHAMSPIGGVGINVAMQDAVAAANCLAGRLARGGDPDPLLANVQATRWRAVTRMQALQKAVQDRVIAPILSRSEPIERPAWPMRLLDGLPLLRRVPGRIVGLGIDPLRIESPDAFA